VIARPRRDHDPQLRPAQCRRLGAYLGIGDSVREFIERVRSVASDGPAHLVVDGGGQDLTIRLGQIAATDSRLVFHTVEQSGLWLNLVEVWCRLGGYSCVSPQIRALAGSNRSWVWFNPAVASERASLDTVPPDDDRGPGGSPVIGDGW